jgi:hypothetical protein
VLLGFVGAVVECLCDFENAFLLEDPFGDFGDQGLVAIRSFSF